VVCDEKQELGTVLENDAKVIVAEEDRHASFCQESVQLGQAVIGKLRPGHGSSKSDKARDHA
jgi:hypothetical protein